MVSAIRKQTKKWTMKDGSKIRICDMSDSHLKNTIKFLERFAKNKVQFYLMECYKAQNFLNGEMALFSMEQEEIRLIEHDAYEDFIPDIYWNMLEDLQRREYNQNKIRINIDKYKKSIDSEILNK